MVDGDGDEEGCFRVVGWRRGDCQWLFRIYSWKECMCVIYLRKDGKKGRDCTYEISITRGAVHIVFTDFETGGGGDWHTASVMHAHMSSASYKGRITREVEAH